MGDTLFVTGAGWVATYDIPTQAQTGVFGASWNIDRNAASTNGRLAVDCQWSDGSNPDAIEIYTLAGTWLATGLAPNNGPPMGHGWATKQNAALLGGV